MGKVRLYDTNIPRETILQERTERYNSLSVADKLNELFTLINLTRKMSGGKPLKEPQGKGLVLSRKQSGMDPYNEELLQLFRQFDIFQVQYLIVGGFAVNRYGYKRTTGDIDIYLNDNTENRRRLIDALEAMGYGRLDPLLTAPIIAGYCEIMMDGGIYADLMTEIPGLSKENFEEYYNTATVDFVDNVPVRFLHYNHLIQNKKQTARNKDLIDIEELEKIQSPGTKP
ncbi:hypothetical protein ACTHGU_19615 [Chitinophagaceae bacterium MMS25-I14]